MVRSRLNTRAPPRRKEKEAKMDLYNEKVMPKCPGSKCRGRNHAYPGNKYCPEDGGQWRHIEELAAEMARQVIDALSSRGVQTAAADKAKAGSACRDAARAMVTARLTLGIDPLTVKGTAAAISRKIFEPIAKRTLTEQASLKLNCLPGDKLVAEAVNSSLSAFLGGDEQALDKVVSRLRFRQEQERRQQKHERLQHRRRDIRRTGSRR